MSALLPHAERDAHASRLFIFMAKGIQMPTRENINLVHQVVEDKHMWAVGKLSVTVTATGVIVILIVIVMIVIIIICYWHYYSQ